MSDMFYRSFEERNRGSRELIKERLTQYLPFVEPILRLYTDAPPIDLGCGRGEWLELLKESGFKPKGVDSDNGMLAACNELGLDAEEGDAIAHLTTLPDDSRAVISAFHVVEHITFDQLRTLATEAHRVLKPGGLLIMETPNPENIIVATRNFYLDPTHQRPIPSELLAFVAEYAGFARVKTLRLQEPKELINRKSLSLHDALYGASPDYAIVAQKQAASDIMSLLNEVFGRNYGLSLDDLLNRWDSRFNRIETQAEQAEAKAEQAEATSNERLALLNAIYASSSWQVTRPLRKIKSLLSSSATLLRHSAARAKRQAKQSLRPLLAAGIKTVNKRPKIRNQLKQLITYFPWLRQRLVRVALNTRVNSQVSWKKQRPVPLELQNMTPYTRQIYQALKRAIEIKNKGEA